MHPMVKHLEAMDVTDVKSITDFVPRYREYAAAKEHTETFIKVCGGLRCVAQCLTLLYWLHWIDIDWPFPF
jgi:hypothetical protein